MGKPHCRLKVNSVHYSTYMNEYRNLDAIKVNIRSTCNVMQKYTFITPEILEVRANDYVVQHNFGHRTAKALKYQPTDALFEDLYIDCTKGKVTRYIGRAIGFVKLKDGGNYPVSARSENSFVVNCKIQLIKSGFKIRVQSRCIWFRGIRECHQNHLRDLSLIA